MSHDTDNDTRGGFPGMLYAASRAWKRHASGSNLMMAATILAFIVANIPAINGYYFDFWNQEVRLQVGDFNVFSHDGHPMNMLAFINDALMAVFFFTVGLEIKREVLVGELSSFKRALLPILGACGGMLLPVLIFFGVAEMEGQPGIESGCAIPMATDIAFSIGVLAILKSRVPTSLKIFLTTLAVADDIGGIIVIATCYSQGVEWVYLFYSLILFGVLGLGSVLQVQSKIFYVGVGAVIWFLFLQSGIHPTIAGVLVAFCVPARPVYEPKRYIQKIREAINQIKLDDDEKLNQRTILTKYQINCLKEVESASDKVISPLQELEDNFEPFVNYVILPLFAFANAGIFLLDTTFVSVFEGVSLAVILGLFVGKFVGIFIFTWLTIKLHLAPMPSHSNWNMVASVCMLGGIGFTVSLFIATLSFRGPDAADLLSHAKLGIVVGSLLSGFVGYLWLNKAMPKEPIVEGAPLAEPSDADHQE